MKTLYKVQTQQDVRYYENRSDAYRYAADIDAEATPVQAVPFNNSYVLVDGKSCHTFNIPTYSQSQYTYSSSSSNVESLKFCVTPNSGHYGGGLYYNFYDLRNQPNGCILVSTESQTDGDNEYSGGTETIYVSPADHDIERQAYKSGISHSNPETLKQLVMQENEKLAQYVYRNGNEIAFIDSTKTTVVNPIPHQAPQPAATSASMKMFS